MPPQIRLAEAADLEAINDIYNHYVPLSTTTYDEQPLSLDDRRRWFEERGPGHPVTVACTDGEVVGYGSLQPFRTRYGYRFTVENSVYVRDDRRGQGIGSAILADQIERARALAYHAFIAGVDSDQTASLALHRKHGFEEVARFRQVGYKFGRWLDVVFMERIL